MVFNSGASRWDEILPDPPDTIDNIIVNTNYPTLRIAPHGGSWLAWLGGRDGAIDAINQTVTIPYGAKNGVLRYYLYMTTEESGTAQDFFILRLRRLDGNVIQQIEYLDNTFADRNHWVLREINVPLESLQGQTVRMQIKGITNQVNKSSFFIDDISLIVSD